MARITELAAVPEILFDIIGYISSTDTLNLGLSCKSLLPVCYKALWTNLSLVPRGTKYCKPWPGLQLKPRFKSEIHEVINNYWLGSRGLSYAKRVDFGPLLNRDTKESQFLMRLLESNALKPTRIDFSLSISDVAAGKHFAAFKRLREYTLSKGPKELRIQLHSDIMHSFPKLLDITKITDLSLFIPTWGDRWVAPNATMGEMIRELTSVLERTPNLRSFSWEIDRSQRGYERKLHFSTISAHLQGLQTAFTNLRTLKSLRLLDFLFHPSFFIVPPESVNKLTLNCAGSPAWWQEFAACPLQNVKFLRFEGRAWDYESQLRGYLDPSEIVPIKTIRLREVAVRGLQTAFCSRKPCPPDLGICLLRRNRDLESYYRFVFARREAKRVIGKYHTRFESNWYLSRSFVEDLYIGRFLDGAKPLNEMETVEEYCRVTILGEVENGNIHAWDRARQRAKDIGAKYKSEIEEQLLNSAERTIHHYTLIFMENEVEQADEDDFKKQCIQFFEQEAQGGRRYGAARKTWDPVARPVNRFRRVFDHLRRPMVRHVTELILSGSETDEITIMRYWVDKALQDFGGIDSCLDRLTLSEGSS